MTLIYWKMSRTLLISVLFSIKYVLHSDHWYGSSVVPQTLDHNHVYRPENLDHLIAYLSRIYIECNQNIICQICSEVSNESIRT